MKSISQDFTTLINSINKAYSQMLDEQKIYKKNLKKEYKKVQKQLSIKINTLKTEERFFDRDINDCEFTSIFLFESLGILEKSHNLFIWILYLEYLDIETLLKDKEFKIFLKHILFVDFIYQRDKKEHNLFEQEIYQYVKKFFGDIRSIFLAHFLIKEKNITLNKIHNITSFVCKNAIIQNISILKPKQQEIVKQITTGVKYEKNKDDSINNSNTTRPYNQNETFSILESAKNSIRIRYITNKKHKHTFHKSPKEHTRNAHYRYYKSGKKVWIQSSIINQHNSI